MENNKFEMMGFSAIILALGMVIGSILQTKDSHKEAIKHNAMQYNTVSGEIEWKTNAIVK